MKSVVREIKSHLIVYFFLALILLAGLFVRIYNLDQNLGFYFDQGRDALVIWNFWKHGDLFLIGPTTGIAGIFRGPWYYWLITPFYILGAGNPIYPAMFLSLTTIVAIFFLYLVAKELGNRTSGLLSALVAGFSYYIVVHSKWLSNPTPMLLISILLLWTLIKTKSKINWTWSLIGFLAGLALQFGSAAEIFYIPIILLTAFWNRKQLPNRKIIILSVFLFFITIVPQLIFDFLKANVLSKAVLAFLFEKESFRLAIADVFAIRFKQYYELALSLISPGDKKFTLPFIFVALGVIFSNSKLFIRKFEFRVLLSFLTIPALGMLFFQGNYGNVFDYYYSGYFFPIILFLTVPLGIAFNNWGGKVVVAAFLFMFIKYNFEPVSTYLKSGRAHFTFAQQKMAVDWIYKDAGSNKFNVDIYVPPVLPYAYEYLFAWIGEGYIQKPSVEESNVLYTLYELDPPSPERLDKWIKRQDTIGVVEKEFSFGAITVQKRNRL